MEASPLAPHSADMPEFADLLEALARPASYPYHPASVEVTQTHISAVFLAGDEVYKLKKPVRFSFLDYSTMELRHKYCEEEVRLNRRLAPTVYLGVVPVLRSGDTYRVREAVNMRDATVVDYLVRMRRLPPERTLAALITGGQVTKSGMHALAQRLVHFHTTAATSGASEYGAPAVVWQALADNFEATAPFVGDTISEQQYRVIQEFSRTFFDQHQELLRNRVLQDRVREGHGDLRCDHVYFLDEGIAIIDCIEFSPRLRTCDVASELAFLAMDLELRGAVTWADELVHDYTSQTEDEDLFTLLPFYQCYRAYVRGKVESLKSKEPEIPAAEQERARQHARRSFRLSYRYARGTPAPVLIVVCGQIGTGKSTVAERLSDHTGFAVLNSDVIRKRIAGFLPSARAATDYQAGLYTPEFTRRTYDAMHAAAEEELSGGRGVIIDATYKDPEHRRVVRELSVRCHVPVLFVECQAPATIVEQRLQRRERAGNSVSDATSEIARRERQSFPPFKDLPEQGHVVIDTEGDVEAALSRIDKQLARANRASA
jgi:aminoglycoside phosphotransferase family enzyme/predicted kinase